METCPITAEPLPDPGQTISHTALTQVRNATNNLAGLHHAYMQALAMHRPTETHTRTIPRSQPPLNLHLLDAASDHWDTLLAWAVNIMGHVNPSFRVPNNNWAIVQAVFQQHVPTLTTWQHAPNMADETLDATTRLERIIHPAQRDDQAPTELERLELLDQLKTRDLTITAACNAITLYTGKPLSKNTVYTWVHRGHITPTGNPHRYNFAELLALHDPEDT